MGVNKVVLIGQALRVPELKWVGEHEAVSAFAIEMTKSYRTAEGVEKHATTAVPIVAYGRLAERCAAEGREGCEVMVEGRVRVETVKDENGKPQSRYCVVADRCEFNGAPPGPPARDVPRRSAREPAARGA